MLFVTIFCDETYAEDCGRNIENLLTIVVLVLYTYMVLVFIYLTVAQDSAQPDHAANHCNYCRGLAVGYYTILVHSLRLVCRAWSLTHS